MFVEWLVANQTAVVVALVFLAVMIFAFAAVNSFTARRATNRRLAADTGATNQGAAVVKSDASMQVRRAQESGSLWSKFIATVGSFAETFQGEEEETEDDEMTALQMRMIQAGYMGASAVRQYFVFRLLFAISFPIIFLAQAPFFAKGLTTEEIVFSTVLMVALGLYLPVIWTGKKRQRRQAAIGNSFPDAIDMMVVCVEAGLGIDAAFNKVGMQITQAHPILAQLFGIVSLELRAGKSRADALGNFADRSGVPAIQSFVTLLVQSDTLGASISQTLRVHADEMRVNRMLKAEEKAAMLPVLLSIPLVVCILPAMLSVILLPGAITIIRQVLPLLEGK